MINQLKVSHLRNNEFLQFLDDIVNRCNRTKHNNSSLAAKVNELSAIIRDLNSVYNKDNSSDVTEKLNQSDALRDDDIVGIRTVCEGFTYHRDKILSEAANRILNSIDRHGKSIARMNFLAQTSVIDAIIYDWENEEELKQSINSLNLSAWTKRLKSENSNFSNLYQQRVDDKVSSSGESFTDLRAKAVDSYKTLSDTIFAFSVIQKNELYTNLVEAINLIINDYSAIIDRREIQKEKTVE